jgi:hypothetical protein
VFGRKTAQMKAEVKAADICKENAAKAADTGGTVYGIDADGWNERAGVFEDEVKRLSGK